MAYELVWEPDGVIKQFSGTVSAREFVEAVENIQGDFRFDDARYVINDLSLVTSHEITEDVLTEVAVLQYGAFASNPNCRVVFVTTDEQLAARVRNTPAVAGLVSYQTEVCPTVSAARDWLDSQPQLHLMSNVMGFRIN
ncbi:MAG: hypothetical protein CVU31_14595 [Betaproteobacteria bacterium HGW-Betaproteobacteria-4]|jgi:hypothetical protein|nr:MAG: hypothetical protein CVU31_14595 [Betaproteobacteria bacterium HGW-Betaproteobacteria-4]